MLIPFIYIIGCLSAMYKAYISFGEEMCETFPKVERSAATFLTFIAIIMAVFSWVAVAYYSRRHKLYLNS